MHDPPVEQPAAAFNAGRCKPDGKLWSRIKLNLNLNPTPLSTTAQRGKKYQNKDLYYNV